jgi:peptide/nickel transport system substrate-binding protein
MPVSSKPSRLRGAGGLLLVGLLTACATQPVRDGSLDTLRSPPSGAARIDSRGQTGGVLRYALSGEPDTFNILAASDSRSKLIALLTSGTLLEFDPVAQQVTAGVASEYHLEDEGRSVRLRLREGLAFSDGHPVSSDDVTFTFDRIFDPKSHNVLKDSLMVDGKPLRVEKLDEHDLIVHAVRPYAAIEYLLSTVPVLPRHLLEADSGQPVEEAWTLSTPPQAMAGLGPFTIVEHKPGISTTLRRNPHYWKVDSSGVQLPYLDRIVLEYVSDRSAQVLQLSSGVLDLSDRLRPEDFRLLKGRENLIPEDLGPSNSLSFLWFNLNRTEGGRRAREYSWFSQRAFRSAVNVSINRTAIAETVYAGLASEAFNFISPANRQWHVALSGFAKGDPETAMTLLRKAGFRWRNDAGQKQLVDPDGVSVEFDLLTRSDDVLGRTAAVIQQDLAEIGIRINIRQEEFRSVISRVMRSRDYAAALMDLDFPLEPLDMTNVLLSSGDLHVWRPPGGGSPEDWEVEVDGLMGKLATTLDRTDRFELFKQVQQIMARECPLIPLINRNVLVVRRSSVRNLEVARVFPYAWGRIWKVYREQP